MITIIDHHLTIICTPHLDHHLTIITHHPIIMTILLMPRPTSPGLPITHEVLCAVLRYNVDMDMLEWFKSVVRNNLVCRETFEVILECIAQRSDIHLLSLWEDIYQSK